MTTKSASTPWGQATIVDALTVQQRAGDKRFQTIVQLLEIDEGETLVRFAYSTGGTARRGPVTLRGRDLERLAAALRDHPALATALSETVAQRIGKMAAIASSGGEVTDSASALGPYTELFSFLMYFGVGMGVLMIIISPLLRRWMHGIH